MYALAARDKLHKKEKDDYRERHSPRFGGKSNGKRQKGKDDKPTHVQKEARYVGTFLMEGGKKADFVKIVKNQLSRVNLKDPSHALLHVSLLITMEGIKVLSYDTHDVVMAHSIRKILYCTSDGKKHLFAIVTRDAQDEDTEKVFTHIFVTAKKDQANELNQIVSKAFKVHFARATISRERKQAAKISSVPQAQRPKASPDVRAQRHRSASPQPSSQPPAEANPPPFNPYLGPSPGSGGNSSAQVRSQGVQNPNRLSAPAGMAPPIRKSWVELTQESSTIQQEMDAIQSRLTEIAEQKRELAGFEDAISQLRTQESTLHQELESKRRQLGNIQFQLQDVAVQDMSNLHLQPPAQAYQPQQPQAYQPPSAQTYQPQQPQAYQPPSTQAYQPPQAQAYQPPQAHAYQPPQAQAYQPPGTSTDLSEPPPYPYSPALDPRSRHSQYDVPLPGFSLEEAVWYHEGIPRDIAMEILVHQPEGSFMVRSSSSSPGSYALTMKGPQAKILHFLIQPVPNGFKLQSSGLVFNSVVDLIHSYAVNKDILPCVLEMSATNPMGMHGDDQDDHGFDSDEEYSQFQNAEYRLLP